MNCPCGLPRAYADCCGRYHAGPDHLAAPTAEALMRSRYTAYVQRREDYLLATWHPTTRPPALDLADDGAKWLGLEVRRATESGPGAAGNPGLPPRCGERAAQDDRRTAAVAGIVEFVARYRIGGRAHRLHETSRFAREDGRWYYVDGELHAR